MSLERYEKHIDPRIAEEDRALKQEELAYQRLAAEREDAADNAAVEQQCLKILKLVDVSSI